MTIICNNCDFGQNLISKTIDWLRFPMAVLVVFIHADGALAGNRGQYGLFDTLTIMFSQGMGRIAVPVFFFISGYLFFKGLSDWDSQVWLGKEKKRVKTLLMPYILWNVIALVAFVAFWIVKSRMNGASTDPVDIISSRGWLRIFWDSNITDSESFVNIFGMDMNNIFPMDRPLWFIRDLMVMTLCAPLIYLLVKFAGFWTVGASGILMILGVGFPFNANFTTAFFFFLFGAYFMIEGKDFLRTFSKYKVPSATVLFVSLIAVILTYNNSSYQAICKICVNVVALSGLLTVFNISAYIMSRENAEVNRTLSQSSFFIFATQALYFESLAALIVERCIPGTGEMIMSIKYFMMVAVTVAMLLGIYCLMKKYFPRITNVLTGARG